MSLRVFNVVHFQLSSGCLSCLAHPCAASTRSHLIASTCQYAHSTVITRRSNRVSPSFSHSCTRAPPSSRHTRPRACPPVRATTLARRRQWLHHPGTTKLMVPPTLCSRQPTTMVTSSKKDGDNDLKLAASERIVQQRQPPGRGWYSEGDNHPVTQCLYSSCIRCRNTAIRTEYHCNCVTTTGYDG